MKNYYEVYRLKNSGPIGLGWGATATYWDVEWVLVATEEPKAGDYVRMSLNGKSRGKISWPERRKGDVVQWFHDGVSVGAFRVRGNQILKAAEKVREVMG